MSGKISNTVPFKLPTEVHSQTEQPDERQTEEIPSEHLRRMEQIYVHVVPRFQSLLSLYEIEKEKARKHGTLKRFPKKFANWRPEGSVLGDEETESILGGLQPTALKYSEYILESKQHSHNYYYISKEHPTKRPSTVCFLDSSPEAGSHSKNPRFGVIHCLYQHFFAHKMYMWAAVSLYKDPWYNSKSGLWCSKDLFGQTVIVLLSSLSHPLTVARDRNLHIWFLDVSL